MDINKARKWLLCTWLIGSLVPFVVIVAQTFADRYAGNAENAWSWLLPSVMPTLGLMTAVTLAAPSHEGRAPTFPFRLAFSASLIYLVLLAATLLAQPFSSLSQFELFRLSHLWLAPVQAFADAAIGAVFLSCHLARSSD